MRVAQLFTLLALAGAAHVQAAPQAPTGASSAEASAPATSAASATVSSISSAIAGSGASVTSSAVGATSTPTTSAAAAASPSSTPVSGDAPGYSGALNNSTSDTPLNFGNAWAALHLDIINGIAASVQNTEQGRAWLQAEQRWIDATHAYQPSGTAAGTSGGNGNASAAEMMLKRQADATVAGAGGATTTSSIQPLNIFTRIYFVTPSRPELKPDSAYAAIAPNATEADPAGQIVEEIRTKLQEDKDIVIPKTRYYAGAGNQLEEILRAQSIDTVILSGIRTSGVILATASHLIDLDYTVYVLSDAVIETPSSNPFPSNTNASAINDAILQGILPKLGVRIISTEQAVGAINGTSSSGSTVAGTGATSTSSLLAGPTESAAASSVSSTVAPETTSASSASSESAPAAPTSSV